MNPNHATGHGDGAQVRQYIMITASYWTFTLTDGALRMLVVLYFYQLGYSPLEIAMLFVFYEISGVVTNLVGGWLGARVGLNRIMNIGLFLQIVALSFLLVPQSYLSVVWVMTAQAISGVAKDLNKMSAKSAIKLLVPSDQGSRLFKWVAFLTGSKNTLKGAGFFLGGVLLASLEFRGAILVMVAALVLVWLVGLVKLRKNFGRSKAKPKFRSIFSKSAPINYLSAARVFLFGSRDIWFVVALPVYLASEFQWSHAFVGGFLAAWLILYGIVQAVAPSLVFRGKSHVSGNRDAFFWAMALSVTPFMIAVGLFFGWPVSTTIISGLLAYCVVFAINSSLHSYLIVEYASEQDVSLDVGFYYMANALGRLTGTVLSGLIYQLYGITACLVASGIFVLLAALFSLAIPEDKGTSHGVA